LADDGGIEKVQLRAESPAVKRNLYVCCSTMIFGVCSYSETYSFCVKIRYQETTSGEFNRLRTLMGVCNSEL
jgi:hypothetical protein